jgi:hypothetical protein
MPPTSFGKISNLARMQAGPDLQTEIAHGVADSLSAPNGAGGTVEALMLACTWQR